MDDLQAMVRLLMFVIVNSKKRGDGRSTVKRTMLILSRFESAIYSRVRNDIQIYNIVVRVMCIRPTRILATLNLLILLTQLL